jgi:hypothetical protein
MENRRALWRLLYSGLALALVLVGCSRSVQQPAGTGARDRCQAYYEALIRRDWATAYAALDSHEQQRCNAQQFSRLAETYRANLGFEPDMVRIQACDEQGNEATAHVVLSGRTGAKAQRYKDAVALRRGDNGWHVVLSANFGSASIK